MGSGSGRVGLGQSSTLDAAVWGSKHGAQEDCRGIRRLDVQQLPTLGGLQVTDVRATHWPRKVPRGKASQRGGDLALDVGEVRAGGMWVKAKETYGTEQLCGELEAGIEVGIHVVRLLWHQNYHEEDCGFLLIDV